MAHIVVYLQRTTRGLHPGSTVALCLAREIVEASRSGSDQVVFLGPEGIQKLFKRPVDDDLDAQTGDVVTAYIERDSDGEPVLDRGAAALGDVDEGDSWHGRTLGGSNTDAMAR